MAARSGDPEEASSYNSKVQDLSSEHDKTRAEREKLERDFPKIQQFQDKRIKLNVGGKLYMTTLQTLTKDSDSMLASMFSGRFKMAPDEEGSFFIDRDPKYFRFILNFLRTGEALLPETALGRIELHMEAEFYNIRAFLEARNLFVLYRCTLLTSDQQATLSDWLGGRGAEGRLIYKATTDGFSVADIHRCCDGKGETITVMKTTNGYLFGGYTDVPWSSDGRWKRSSKSFLFAFNNYTTGNSQLKMILSGTHNDYAVCHFSSSTLWFGNYGAIGVQGNSTHGLNGTSNWHDAHTYQFPQGVKDNSWLVGEEHFQLTEIEVLSLHGQL